MNKNQQEIINLLGYMVLAPTKETPAKKLEKEGPNAATLTCPNQQDTQ